METLKLFCSGYKSLSIKYRPGFARRAREYSFFKTFFNADFSLSSFKCHVMVSNHVKTKTDLFIGFSVQPVIQEIFITVKTVSLACAFDSLISSDVKYTIAHSKNPYEVITLKNLNIFLGNK